MSKLTLFASAALVLASLALVAPASAGWCDGIGEARMGSAIKVDATSCKTHARTGTVGYVAVPDVPSLTARDFYAPSRDGQAASDYQASLGFQEQGR